MIKLIDLLKESLLAEYNKSQLEYISSQLGIERNSEFDSLMNALDAQGIKYPELKNKITKGEIKSFNDLKSLKTQSKSDIKQLIKSDSQVVYDGDDFFVVIPYTYKASCFYGANTKWCTTSKETDEQWNDYVYKEGGTLYYILDKSKPSSNPLYKIAVLVDLDDNIIDIFNAKDKRINKKYLDKIGIKDKINFISKYDEIISINNINPSLKVKLLNPQRYKITPEDLDVKGDLDLSFTPITFLPDNLNVEEDLSLVGTKITSLPNNLKVGGDLNLTSIKITSIPDDLKVGGRLSLAGTKITSLPNNLKVGGDLWLSSSKIKSLPNNLKVGGDLKLSYTPLSEKYTKEQIRQMVPGVKGEIQIFK